MNFQERLQLKRRIWEKKAEENLLKAIKRKAKKDGGTKHSQSAWMLDKYFGAGDYSASDYGEPREARNYEE